MDGIFYPVSSKHSDITGSEIDTATNKMRLDISSGEWLSSLWDYEEGTIEILQPSKITSQDTHIYRVGNICVLKIQLIKSSADSTESYTDMYQLPWKPMYEIYDRRNYGYKSGASPVYTCFHCRIGTDGIVYFCSYKGTQEYCAILTFPIYSV